MDTLGEHNIVAVVEAPDDTSITALGLSTGALGNVRTQTLRAFTQADMKTILGKMVRVESLIVPPAKIRGIEVPNSIRSERIPTHH